METSGKTTKQAFQDAMREFDDKFRHAKEWENWEANKAHKYAIEFESRRYPVKQIVSIVTGVPRGQLYGGEYAGHANQAAKKAGFTVVELRQRNPDWSRDELILALDLYLRHRPIIPGKTSPEINELSDLLNQLGSALALRHSNTFRNPNGVYMKLMNFKALDPDYVSQGKVGLKAGGKFDQEVWDQFAKDPAKCRRLAERIRAEITYTANAAGSQPGEDGDDDEEEAPEGRLLTRVHRARERNRKLVARKKSLSLRRFGKLACEACGFDFWVAYGERGKGFIECHHTKPVADMEPGAKTKLADLVLLCANCHRMVHAGRPWLSIEELACLRRDASD